MKIEWILCPFCGSKTRLKIRDDTVLENFPLYCPKCKHETLITVRKLNLSIVQEPDAQTAVDFTMTGEEKARKLRELEADPVAWAKFMFYRYAKYEFAGFQKII